MKTPPTSAAWQHEPFWKEVVSVISGGKKLRPEHYLQRLDAAELEQLRLALSCSGSYAEQQKLCPPRRGGASDGLLPSITGIAEISQAMRQVDMLRELEAGSLIEAAAKQRCGVLGLNSQLTNAVVRIVGEEALKQKAAGVVDKFALKAAGVLIKRESQTLERDKFEEMKRKAAQADAAKGIIEDKEISEDERRLKMRELFGVS